MSQIINFILVPQAKNAGNSNSMYRSEYDNNELRAFFKTLNLNSSNIQNSSLYFDIKNAISQTKIRDAGFIIKRDPENANYVVVDNLSSEVKSILDNSVSEKSLLYRGGLLQAVLNHLAFLYGKGYKLVTVDYVYKYLYKYEGNLELYNTLNDLLKGAGTFASNNVTMAMEMMSNANWLNNEIYLQKLFNDYYNTLFKYNSYKTKVSFKGFLNSLDFEYQYLRLINASDFKELCKTDEHHSFVFTLFDEAFKEDLNGLLEQYKVKLIDIKYKIDTNKPVVT